MTKCGGSTSPSFPQIDIEPLDTLSRTQFEMKSSNFSQIIIIKSHPWRERGIIRFAFELSLEGTEKFKTETPSGIYLKTSSFLWKS